MSDVALSVRGIGKRYRVPRREGATGQLVAHLKEFLGVLADPEKDSFWALQDVSFDLRQGEILGILGKNGSGKSTLLKILSGVTTPTAGRAVLRGEIGSLLEVGTGFHPDLTGRQNVFLNGALLGMSKQDIRAKFDEIVAFAGVEQFIDMPVKRYSSGMYVRLAYAIASLLNTDILILDEVLAVGDAEFRKKSLDNMERVAKEGRTILFVSHNSAAVTSLCTRGLVLSHGNDVFQGSAREAVTHYLRLIQRVQTVSADQLADVPGLVDLQRAVGFDGHRPRHVLTSVETCRMDGTPSRVFQTGDGMRIRIGYDVGRDPTPYFCVFFLDERGERVMTLYSYHNSELPQLRGRGVVECVIPELRVFGEFSLMIDYGRNAAPRESVDCVPDATQLAIELGDYFGHTGLVANQGYVAQRSNWSVAVEPMKQVSRA